MALDALRWGAHATALDALGASVGVLTARGGHVASRTAAHAKHASQSVFRIIALVGHGSSE